MRNIHFFILIFAIISVIGCFNPFFPEKGDPPPIESTPERTIELFKNAYQRRDFISFESLIYSKNEFSSYTQVSDYSSYTLGKLSFEPKVLIDSLFSWDSTGILPPNRYYYELKWAQEEQIHRKMFNGLEEIVFSVPFFSTNTEYEIFENDTISALVKTQPSKMRIKYQGQLDSIDITGQIFAMKRENGFWKIWKWIELN